MLQPRIGFGGQHHRRGPGQAGQPRQGFAQGGLDRLRLADRSKLGLDRLPLRLGEIADLHQGIDEKPQAQFGRQPAGRGMRRVDQAELLEIRHHVAHRGRRQRHRDQARDVARADRLAGGEITLDDLTKYVPRTLIELGEPGMRRDQANRIVVGHRQLQARGPRFNRPNLSISGAGYKQTLSRATAKGRQRALPLPLPPPTSTANRHFC